MSNDRLFLPVRDVVRELGLSRNIVLGLIRAQQLPAIQLGSDEKMHYRVRRSDVERYRHALREESVT